MKKHKHQWTILLIIVMLFMVCLHTNIVYANDTNETNTSSNSSNSTVTIVYNPSVEISYVDESNKIIKEKKIIEGEEGKQFEIIAEKIEGYELKNTIGNTKGTFGKDFEVKFVYQKNNKSNNNNSNNNSNNNNNHNNTNGNLSSNKTNSSNNSQIIDGVKTGDYYSIIILTIGIGILFSIIGIFVLYRKNKKH